MTDRTSSEAADLGLPLQPTGSGVADLEVAYEQMKLAEDAGTAGASPSDEVPPTGGPGLAESEAHPS